MNSYKIIDRNQAIIEAYNEGEKTAAIAKEFGITDTYVCRILSQSRKNDMYDVAVARRSNAECVRYPGLQKWMKDNDFTLTKLSERSGLNYATLRYDLSMYSSKQCDPKKFTIDAILAVTGLTYEQAFGEATSDADV